MSRAGLVFAATSALLGGCWHSSPGSPTAAGDPSATKLGAVTILCTDRDSAEIVAHADLVLRGPTPGTMTSSKFGFATFDRLQPGTYDLVATFADQPVEIDAVTVRANQTNYLDVTFTLGQPDPIKQRWGDGRLAPVEKFHPRGMATTVSRIEGTVSDVTTHARVVGASITAQRGTAPDVLQAVTDDQGRFRFDDVLPGSYTLSAYYTISGRGQIEVRRSGIQLDGGEGARVPLAIEIAR